MCQVNPHLVYLAIWSHRRLRDQAMKIARLEKTHSRLWARTARQHNRKLLSAFAILKASQLGLVLS